MDSQTDQSIRMRVRRLEVQAYQCINAVSRSYLQVKTSAEIVETGGTEYMYVPQMSEARRGLTRTT